MAEIPEDLKELHYNCVHWSNNTPLNPEALRKLIERIATLEAEVAQLKQERDKGYTLAHDCGFQAATLLAESNIEKLQQDLATERDKMWTATQRDSWRRTCEKLQRELAAANEKIERLCAPVTADEAFPHSLDTTGMWAKTVDALIAARAKDRP